MALVSLSSVAAFFDGDAMLVASAVKMPMIHIFFFVFEKRARHISAVVHARMRHKIIRSWRVSVILSGPGSGLAVLMSVQEFKTQRKTKVRTRKLIYFILF